MIMDMSIPLLWSSQGHSFTCVSFTHSHAIHAKPRNEVVRLDGRWLSLCLWYV